MSTMVGHGLFVPCWQEPAQPRSVCLTRNLHSSTPTKSVCVYAESTNTFPQPVMNDEMVDLVDDGDLPVLMDVPPDDHFNWWYPLARNEPVDQFEIEANMNPDYLIPDLDDEDSKWDSNPDPVNLKEFMQMTDEDQKTRCNVNSSSCNIRLLSDENCFHLVNVEHLNLANNTICELPPVIGLLSKLRTLNLRRNRLGHIPEAIGCMKSLTSLDLSVNQLVELPASIATLPELAYLNVSKNQLTTLPWSTYQPRHRALSIDAAQNLLTEVPDIPGVQVHADCNMLLSSKYDGVEECEQRLVPRDVNASPALATPLSHYTYVNHLKPKCFFMTEDEREESLENLRMATYIELNKHSPGHSYWNGIFSMLSAIASLPEGVASIVVGYIVCGVSPMFREVLRLHSTGRLPDQDSHWLHKHLMKRNFVIDEYTFDLHVKRKRRPPRVPDTPPSVNTELLLHWLNTQLAQHITFTDAPMATPAPRGNRKKKARRRRRKPARTSTERSLDDVLRDMWIARQSES